MSSPFFKNPSSIDEGFFVINMSRPDIGDINGDHYIFFDQEQNLGIRQKY
ncbi:hypothetical protein SAMN05443669_10851 [Flavobacterium xanthum]|uniref:Uncharacterized protein n=2 Tax=Flavobacterium xanthum TaxID=69322 RepID=A0A1M7LTB8_9FLAO|nr:hypothetical protein SAMN05443669_10851 [Flavobacterium xanthum]